MSDDLHIWLPADLSEPWFWAAAQDQGLAVDDSDKAALGGRNVRNVNVIMPGQQVRIFAHDLPKIREAERVSAAGFSIEDKIAAPLIDQHLALGTGEDKRIAVVSRAIIKAVSAELTRSGLGGAKLYADFDGLSHGSEPLLLPDRLIHPGPLGYTLDRAWAKTDAQERSTQQVLNLINIETAINLRTGDFAPKANVMIGRVQLLRAAALLAVSGLVWLGLLSAQNRSTFEHAAFIRSETARMYSEFTGQAAPANPALSVVRNVKSNGQSQADFLNLSQILFQAIEMTDGVSVETLQFDENQNQLTLRVRYPQFESASELEQSVAASGGEFRAGGIREQGGKLIGDAVLIAGAGS